MSSWPYHVAVYNALDAALSCPVYDAVPDNATYPYCVMDSQLATDAQLTNRQRERITIYLSFWSDVEGQQEVLELMTAAKTALQNNKLALSSGVTINTVVVRETTQRDIADETYQGLMTLEARVNT